MSQVRDLEHEGDGLLERDAAHHRQARGVPHQPVGEELRHQEGQVAQARVRVDPGVCPRV